MSSPSSGRTLLIFGGDSGSQVRINTIWAGRNDIPAFPEPKPVGYLDELYGFAQQASDWLDSNLKDETEVTVFKSIRYKKKSSDDQVKPDDIDAVGEQFVLGKITSHTFNLDNESFSQLERIRVRGISAFLVARHDTAALSLGSRISIGISAPDQKVEGRSVSFEPIEIEAGFASNGSDAQIFGAEQLQNIDPTLGDWTITAGNAIGRVTRRNDANGVQDIVIAVHCVASVV